MRICPNCLTKHPKGQCNSQYRCRIEKCNGFHHSTIYRNNFKSSQTFSPTQQQQSNQGQQHQQQTHNQFQNHSGNNYHNNRGQQNNGHQTQITANRSQFQPNGFNYGRVVGYNHNNNTCNAFGQNNNTNRFNQNYNLNKNDVSTFKRNYNHPNNFMLNTNLRQQSTGHSHNQTDTQNQSQRQQNFNNNNSNPRPQNRTCSNNQIISWIRPQLQLQANTVILYTENVSIETYALLDSGSDNTQITKTKAKAVGINNTDHIAVPISSFYGEHIITSTEVLQGIGSINSTRPLFNLPVYATSASDFQKPNVPVELLSSICADYDNLNNIIFPQLRDNKIGVLIGAHSIIATVPLKFTTGPPGTPYGVLTQLGWTVTGPIPQKYKPNSNKQEINYNITLYNRIKNPEQDIENDMLQKFWTMEGKNLVSGKKDTDSRWQECSWNTKKDDMPQRLLLWDRTTLERWQ